MRNKKKISNSKDIMQSLESHKDILKKYKIKKIGLFGSFVRGQQKKKSDIDLLVEFEKNMFDSEFNGYFDNYVGLQSALEKILHRKIDLLTPDMISPYIKPYIIKEVRYV